MGQATDTPLEMEHLLSIIVPVYNEGENFQALYRELQASVRTPHQVFVVYDFDEDDTIPVVRTLQQNSASLRLVKNRSRGVLAALRTGFAIAPPGPCVVVMADLSDDLDCVDLMVDKYRQGYKIVCASRYMRGGRHLGGSPVKRTLSRLAGLTLHRLANLPTHDATNNFRLYDRAMLDDLTIESRGFEIALEITVKAAKRGYPICEVPTTWRDRTVGTSRFKLAKWLPHYLRWYLYALRG